MATKRVVKNPEAVETSKPQAEALLKDIAVNLVLAGRALQLLAKHDPSGFPGWRRRFSSLAVLALGRMGKLNLNASVSDQAREAWSRNDGSEL